MNKTRPNTIVLRLNDEELTRLNEMVAKTVFNREQFLRKMLDGYTVQEVPKDYIMFRRDMINACGALNQIPRFCTSLTPPEKTLLFNIADQLQSVIAVMNSIYRSYFKEGEKENEHKSD